MMQNEELHDQVINQTEKSNLWTHLRVQLDLEKKGMFAVSMIFLFFGLSDLFATVYIENIIQWADPGIDIAFPEPTFEIIFESVFSDILTIGMIMAIFYGMRAFAGDVSVEKPIYYFLSRPITRSQYYLGKSIIRTIALIIGVLVTTIVVYLLGTLYVDPISISIILGGTLIVILSLVANYHLILMFNARYSTVNTGILGGGFLASQLFIGTFTGYVEWLKWISPLSLGGIWSDILFNHNFENLLFHSVALMIWMIVPLIVGNIWYNDRDL